MLTGNIIIKHLSDIFNSTSVEVTLFAMKRSSFFIGADKFSYHPEILFEGVASARSEIFHDGYPYGWMDIYTKKGGQLIDPIPDVVMRSGRIMTWAEALSKVKLSDAQKDYVKHAQQHNLFNGLGFPLWGPKNQNAFVAIGFPEPDFKISTSVVRTEHMILLAGHQKIVEILSVASPEAALSKRESEVLTWVGKGKSNTDIAAILSLSPETVATYMRRIYSKLKCHDRVGAVLKALRLGLIRI